MPMPADVPLQVYRGDSHAWRFRVWTDESHSVAFDLTEASVAAQIRRGPDVPFAVDLACEVEPPNVVTVRLDAAASQRTPIGVWDMQASWSDGRVVTLAAGKVDTTADVTRD